MSVMLVWVSFSSSLTAETIAKNLTKLLAFYKNNKRGLLLRKNNRRQSIRKIGFVKRMKTNERPFQSFQSQHCGHLHNRRIGKHSRGCCNCQRCEDPFNLVAPINYRRPRASYSRKSQVYFDKNRGFRNGHRLELRDNLGAEKGNFFNSNAISPKINRSRENSVLNDDFILVKMAGKGNSSRARGIEDNNSEYSKEFIGSHPSFGGDHQDKHSPEGATSGVIEATSFARDCRPRRGSSISELSRGNRSLKTRRKKKRKGINLSKKRKSRLTNSKRKRHRFRRKMLMYSELPKLVLSTIKEAKEESEECSVDTSCMSIGNSRQIIL